MTGAALAGSLLAAPAAALPGDLPGDRNPALSPDDEGYVAPLEISIDQLTPGVLPRTGPLVVSGTITNVDLETWEGINLYPLFNAGPGCAGGGCAAVMTTPDELAAAADSDPEAPIGARYVEVNDTIATLAPGGSARYTIRIPQRILRQLFPVRTTGVYWFGVHASGLSTSTPRDQFADGRARTFLPSVRNPDAPGRPGVEAAVVLPLRGRIAHEEDGSLARTSGWEQSLAVDGDLGGPLAFGAAAGATPVSWLVDPAIPDAVRRLALGNPPRDVTPRPAPDDEPSASDQPSESEPPAEAAEPVEETALTRAAEGWLEQARTELTSDAVALLPYGDPDVAAAGDALPSLYPAARQQPAVQLTAWEVTSTPVVAAPDGYLDAAGIDAVDDGATLLLGNQAFPAETFTRPPTGAVVGDRPVVVTAPAASDGGPGPDPAQAPVALRQRLLAEAVVRLLRARGGEAEPLVVVLPPTVSAAGAEDFWSGLSLPWLDLVELDDLAAPASGGTGAAAGDRQLDPDELTYPETQEEDELPGRVVAEAGRLIRVSRALQSILGEDYTVGRDLVAEALAGTSYAMRSDVQAADRLERTRGWVEDQLGQLDIDAPSGVTLSSDSGSFNVAVSNGLDQPVTVEIRASTDSGAAVRVAGPVRLAANSRTSVPVEAQMARTGVHNVTLQLTDADGYPIGAEDSLPLRSGQAGAVIWAIIGAGIGILFVAITIRLVRRYRRHKTAETAETAEAVT